MGLYVVHREIVAREYKTYGFSRATLFFVISILLTLIIPFLIAYRSGGFWRRIDVYREQPKILFKYQMIVLLETLDASDFIAWSTYPHLNNLLENHLRMPTVKSWEEDTNGDGIKDALDLQLEMQLEDGEDIYSIKLILFFDYQLHKYSDLEMECLAYITYNSPIPGMVFTMIGDLAFHQRIPLPHAGYDSTYNVSIIDDESIFAKAYDLATILKEYSGRNVSTILQNVYPIWVSGRSPQQPFIAKAYIRYPEETIQYTPGFWQFMKWAWIQYLSILVVFAYIFKMITSFVFTNQIIHTLSKYKNL